MKSRHHVPHITGIHFCASDDGTQYSMLPHVPSHEGVIKTDNEYNQQRHAAEAWHASSLRVLLPREQLQRGRMNQEALPVGQ